MWKSEIHGNDDKLPTVSQWMKTTSKEAWEVTRLVKLIWTPNVFDNYSLDTESFRIRIGPNHSFFEVLEENLELWIEDRSVLAVSFTSDKKPQMTFELLEKEQADWSPLGDHGWKLGQVEAKQIKRAKTKTRSNSSNLVAGPQQALEGPLTDPA